MNSAFKWCVAFLEYWAAKFGMSYEEINIWIFCIIEPVVFFIMLFYIIHLRKKIRIKLNINMPLLPQR